MKKEWPKVRLGEVLTRHEESIELQPDTTYREITVRLWGKGVVLRGIVTGAEVAAQRRYVARQGQFILSRIDARNGALGIVPPELDGAIITSDFPVFRITGHRLLPAYLGWMSRTKSFVEECLRASEGTTNRVRLQESKFLERQLPLPPLAEQRRVVARIDELAAQIHEARTLRDHATSEAVALTRSRRNQAFRKLQATVSPARLDSLAACRLGKMLSQEAKTGVGSTPYLRNANVQWDRLDLREVYEMDFTDAERAEFALQRGDILVCEGGDIGKAAMWNDEIAGCCYQKAVHRLRCDNSKVIPRFLMNHLFWAASQGHWLQLKTQTTIPHLTGVTLKAYPIFIPALREQRRIVAELDALQVEVDALGRLQAESRIELGALLPAALDRAFKGEL